MTGTSLSQTVSKWGGVKVHRFSALEAKQRKMLSLPEHCFETVMLGNIKIETDSASIEDHNTALEVFVDDFILATNDLSMKHLTKLSRAMINGIHSIFPPPESSYSSKCNEDNK